MLPFVSRVIFSGVFAAAVLVLVVSPANAIENKDVYFGGAAKEKTHDFSRVKVRGTISEMPNIANHAALVLSSSGKTYFVNVASGAKIIDKSGAKIAFKKFIIGDMAEVTGSIKDSGAIESKKIKNLSISNASYKNFSGTVRAINAKLNTFTIVKGEKKYAIKASQGTKISIPGVKSKISLKDLKIGDRVFGRTASDNIRNSDTAKIISVLQRNSAESAGQKTITSEGVIAKIGAAAAPAVLEIINGSETNEISVTANTVIVRGNFGKSSLAEFQIGDKIRIIGTKDKVDSHKISAKMLKNDNLKSLYDLTIDTDQDGIPDIRDLLLLDHDNDSISDDSDIDDDNDGLTDSTDSRPFDFDNDGIDDAADADDDNDGMTDAFDSILYDHDNDTINDAIDLDDDNDGLTDSTDSKSFDHDNDGINDAADQDDDNDSILDSADSYPIDHDNDGTDDAIDLDDDNDGLTDSTDSKPFDYDNDGIDDLSDPFPFQYNNGKIMKVGHRGAPGYAPENTLKSFQKALELGAEMIEIDVRVCKTGELIVMHDSFVNRTTNGSGQVADLTFAELRLLDAGDGEKIPTLAEVFELINKRAQIIIELKDPGSAAPVLALIENYVQNNGWSYENFIISSFDIQELSAALNLNKNIRISANINTITDYEMIMNSNLSFWSINLRKELINGQHLIEAHNRDIKVFAWIVNELENIDLIKSFDVDGIIGDFPDRL